MTKRPDLVSAYELAGPQANLDLYAQWAETYDQTFVKDHDYAMPGHIADAVLQNGTSGRLLDVGVGTGVMGELLTQRWTGQMHGIDISPEMLAVAERKGLYDALFEGDLLQTLPMDTGTYDVITSAGTFTLGHLGPEALPELFRVAKDGAVFVIGINCQHYHAAGFPDALDDMNIRPTLTEHRLYGPGATGDHADDLGYVCCFRVKR